MDIRTFLQPALQPLKDFTETTSNSYDEVFLISLEIAYFSIAGYCRRVFHNNTVIEEYENIEEKLELKGFPVKNIIDVKAEYGFNSFEDIATDEYRIMNNALKFADANLKESVKVEYEFGYNSISESPLLLKAVITQALAIYKKKDFIGLVSTDDVNPSSADMVDIRLMPAVKDMVWKLKRYAN